MIVVTGATGFIGSRLVKRLLNKNFDVGVLCLRDEIKTAKALFGREVRIFKGNVLKKETLKRAFRGAEKVVHLAGVVSYDRKKRDAVMKVNAEGTKNVVDACSNVEKIIFSSSVSVYGEVKMGMTAGESYPLRPFNFYGESKLLGERHITNSGIDFVILRFAPVYGAGSPQWKKNLRMLEKGFPLPKIDTLTHILSVENAISALEKSLKRGRGIYNIADEKPIAFKKLASFIVNLLGKKPRFIHPFLFRLMARLYGAGDYVKVLTINRNYDIGKAKKELNYNPESDMERTIKEMVKWYKGKGNYLFL